MNVLSLFDGQSCGQIALKELGIMPDKYYASEIDKYAIMQTQHNFPETIQLGSVLDVDVSKLEPIDMILAGSPCTNFSAAGKRNGMSTVDNEEIYTLERYLQLKSEGFQFEGQSYLFWEYMRILTDIRKYNPDVKFLLENVEMGNKWERVLSEAIGVFGVHINSALVSAQNRKRIYLTNIRVKEVGLFGELHSDIPQPKDEGILLKDILEEEVDEKYYLSKKAIDLLGENLINKSTGKEKSMTIDASYYKGVGIRCNDCRQVVKVDRQLNSKPNQEKASCFTAGGNSGGNHSDMDLICIKQLPRGANKGGLFFDKSPTLTSNSFEHNNHVLKDYRIRRLTPTECARLQTIPEWYKWVVSETQQYKMLGNGWNIKTIMHILKYLK